MQSGSKEMLLNKEVEEIHKENVAKLESMSHEEILEEQARIKSSLGKARIKLSIKLVTVTVVNRGELEKRCCIGEGCV